MGRTRRVPEAEARAMQLWLCAWLWLWLAGAAAAEDVPSLLGALRPAPAVVRAVRRAAPHLFLHMEERVRAWGYPFEEHVVRTEDGYLLTLHRIPRGRASVGDGGAGEGEGESASEDAGEGGVRPAALLQHGLLGCSEQWVLGGPGVAPGLILADNGYDVWMCNFRGNHHSRKHKSLKPKDPRFWMFSFHEHGMYDVPAAIDYVLNATRQEKLFYVGHSMGSAALAVATSLRPEYNAKVRLWTALGPGIFIEDALVLRTIAANYDYIKTTLDALPTYEIVQKTDSLISFIFMLCSDKSFSHKMCAVLASTIFGVTDLNNSTGLCDNLAGSISSTSALNIVHYGQEILTGEFRPLDRGAVENARAYGTPRPPAYPLPKVTAPVAIFASDGDFLVPKQGIKKLTNLLPNVVTTFIINEKFFNHLDFFLHPKLYDLIMKQLLKLMKEF